MNCREFSELIDEGCFPVESFDDAELMSHAVVCAACRQTLDDARLLAESVAVWKASPTQVDLNDAILTAWKIDRQLNAERPVCEPLRERPAAVRSAHERGGSLRSARNSLIAMFAGLATLVLIAIQSEAPRQAERPRVAAAPTVEPPVDELVRDAGHAWLALAFRAGSDVEDAARVVVPKDDPAAELLSGELLGDEFLGGVERQIQPWQDRLDTVGKWLDRGG